MSIIRIRVPNFVTKKRVGYALILLVVLIFIFRVIFGGGGNEVVEAGPPKVAILPAQEYQKERATVRTVGEIESLEQVELRSQLNEDVTSVLVEIGDEVRAGQILVRLDSTNLSVALDQAQAALSGESARRAETERGARVEDISIKEKELENTEQSLENLYDDVDIIIGNAFNNADDALNKQLDALFVNDNDFNPQLSFTATNKVLETKVENERRELQFALDDLSALQNTTSASDEVKEQALQDAKTQLNRISKFLSDISALLNETTSGLPEATLTTYKTNVSLARTNTTASLSQVDDQLEAIVSQRLTVERVQEELNRLVEGNTQEQIDLVVAGERAASAQVRSAEVNLAKTVIRSPISGFVSSVPVREGDLLSVGSRIATVVNTNGLQVKAFINPDDVALVEEGARVLIEGNQEGTLSRVSPSVDPDTKKVEVLVAVADSETTDLVIGEFANLRIFVKEDPTSGKTFFLPLETVRVTPQGAYVYIVTADNTIDQQQIELGRIIGESVEVLSGLFPETRIVSSVRGLDVGEEVEVLNN